MNYCEFYKLKEKPFEEVCDTRFFFESDDHREALDRMLYVVNDRNMNIGLLTGEIGSGKTLTSNVFARNLSRHDFEVIPFVNSSFPFTDILYDVCTRLTFRDPRITLAQEPLPKREDRYLFMQTFKKKLEILVYEEKRHLVLLFDEAQLMQDGTLDEVKGLTNISSETENYLTMFFIGQPELRDKVKALKQIDQRIFLRFHLNNLDFVNTVKYINHRLHVAGMEIPSLFSQAALEVIFRESGGTPREINRLCKLALTWGWSQGHTQLDKDDIQVVVDDLRKNG